MTIKLRNHIKDDQGHIYLEIVENSANHLNNVIEDALDLSRIENSKFEINREMVDLRKLIKEVQSIMVF